MGAVTGLSCGHVAEPGYHFTLTPGGVEVCPECWVKGHAVPGAPLPPLPDATNSPPTTSAIDDFAGIL